MGKDEPYFKDGYVFADDGICDNITRMKIITGQSSDEGESDSDRSFFRKHGDKIFLGSFMFFLAIMLGGVYIQHDPTAIIGFGCALASLYPGLFIINILSDFD